MQNDPESAYAAAPLPPEGSLFETFADRVLRRVDEVMMGVNCTWPTKEPQRRLRITPTPEETATV